MYVHEDDNGGCLDTLLGTIKASWMVVCAMFGHRVWFCWAPMARHRRRSFCFRCDTVSICKCDAKKYELFAAVSGNDEQPWRFNEHALPTSCVKYIFYQPGITVRAWEYLAEAGGWWRRGEISALKETATWVSVCGRLSLLS
jgi:hypothetical protein